MPSIETKEKAKHGEQLFPLQRYITVLQKNAPSVTTHWHEEAEFTRILEGHCTYQIEFKAIEAGPGDLLFIPPEVIHSITVRPGEKMCSETYVFHMNFIGGNFADVCGLRYLTPMARQQIIPPYRFTGEDALYKPAGALFEKISAVFSEKELGYELLLKAALLELIALILPFSGKADSLPSLQNEHIGKLKTVLSYIEEHLSEPVTIEELSGLCFFSQYHFMRFFKNYVGMPCLKYIKMQRLEKAAELLKAGYSPMDAALLSGFENLSYFYREFKKQYGMTPKKMQESLKDLVTFDIDKIRRVGYCPITAVFDGKQ